jgi:C-terminal peptidase prc
MMPMMTDTTMPQPTRAVLSVDALDALDAPGTATPTSMPAISRQRLFEEVWQTVDDHYLYDDFRGLDWDAVYTEFAGQVAAAESNAELYRLLSAMVSRLNDQHSRFLAPSDVVEENAINIGQETYVGVGVITVATSDGALIQQVFPNSPAAQAGLRPRDRIIAIDGADYVSSNDIRGLEGSQVRLTVVRPGSDARDVILTRRAVKGHISPTVYRMPGDIGYLGITTLWVNDMTEQVSGALTDMVVERPLHGLIVDLRGNTGGWRDVLTGILSHFVRGEVGEFFDRQRTTPLVIRESSGPDLRGLPLVVLIDSNTASYAELLAGILQLEADAFVIGVNSSGNTETIYAYDLDAGARLWVAQEGFRLRNGVNLEGQGVQPDLLLDVDWTAYSQENDPQILEAVRLLTESELVNRHEYGDERLSGNVEPDVDIK